MHYVGHTCQLHPSRRNQFTVTMTFEVVTYIINLHLGDDISPVTGTPRLHVVGTSGCSIPIDVFAQFADDIDAKQILTLYDGEHPTKSELFKPHQIEGIANMEFNVEKVLMPHPFIDSGYVHINTKGEHVNVSLPSVTAKIRVNRPNFVAVLRAIHQKIVAISIRLYGNATPETILNTYNTATITVDQFHLCIHDITKSLLEGLAPSPSKARTGSDEVRTPTPIRLSVGSDSDIKGVGVWTLSELVRALLELGAYPSSLPTLLRNLTPEQTPVANDIISRWTDCGIHMDIDNFIITIILAEEYITKPSIRTTEFQKNTEHLIRNIFPSVTRAFVFSQIMRGKGKPLVLASLEPVITSSELTPL
jgi:hypothetical protein